MIVTAQRVLRALESFEDQTFKLAAIDEAMAWARLEAKTRMLAQLSNQLEAARDQADKIWARPLEERLFVKHKIQVLEELLGTLA